jgi:Sulfotransferase family
MSSATIFPILSRHRDRQFAPTSPADFTLGAGVPAPVSTLGDPQWSLYSLDLAGGQAVFLHLPPGTDLSSAPFLPQRQFETATQALTLPLDMLPAAARDLALPRTLVFLFSIGRCGTTLAHHILNSVPGVLALSEPRAFVTLAMARHDMAPERAQDLIAAVTRFCHRPLPGRPAEALAIKLHSQCLFQAEAYHRAFPQAKLLFLYRDALSWGQSFSRFMQKLGTPLALDPTALRRFWSILSANTPAEELAHWLDISAAVTPHAPLVAAGWAHALAELRRLQAHGLPFHCLRYDDLESQRRASITALLDHCGLAITAMDAALAAFDRDSQEGTDIARGGTTQGFSDADRRLFLATLAGGPNPLPPDLRL